MHSRRRTSLASDSTTSEDPGARSEAEVKFRPVWDTKRSPDPHPQRRAPPDEEPQGLQPDSRSRGRGVLKRPPCSGGRHACVVVFRGDGSLLAEPRGMSDPGPVGTQNAALTPNPFPESFCQKYCLDDPEEVPSSAHSNPSFAAQEVTPRSGLRERRPGPSVPRVSGGRREGPTPPRRNAGRLGQGSASRIRRALRRRLAGSQSLTKSSLPLNGDLFP